MFYSAALPNALRVLTHCGNLSGADRVVVVTDFEKLDLATIVATAARTVSKDVNLVVMPPRELDGEEPPAGVAAAMQHADLIVSLVARSITHTSAVQNALQAGARAVMLTAFTEAMFLRGGIDFDFRRNREFCFQVASQLTSARRAHLTSAGGTDLWMDITDRPGNPHSGVVFESGEMTTVPNVESSVSPIEGSAEGIIVGDASVPYYEIGLLSEPVRMDVVGGKVTRIAGGVQAKQIEQMMAKPNDPNVYNIAQLSFGLNPMCRMQGVMLEDEGVYGTSHIGIGTSTLLGGKVRAPMHFDIIMWRPTLELDGTVVLRDGEWCLPAN